MKPGDLCQLFRAPNGRVHVRHILCDQWKDGVVTDGATGDVAEPREYENECLLPRLLSGS